MKAQNNKICLIYPGISWSGFKTFGKKGCGECNFIHHGVASLAAILNKNGFEVEYVDFRKISSYGVLRKIIAQSSARLFGISSTTVDFDYSIKAAKIIKKVSQKNVVVVGGVHATVRPQDALKVKEFDYVVTGEGELALLKLARGERPKKRLIMGEPVDLESIPNINRELFDHVGGEMMNPFVADLPTPFATFMSSRGCPFNCTFCQPAERMIFKGKVRLRSIKSVVGEMVEVKRKYGLKSFLIHDDLFLLTKERVNEFVEEYGKAQVGAVFMCQARADLIIKYEAEIKKLKEVGLCGVMIGFESGSQRVLDYLNKQVKVRQNLEAAKICRRLGIKVWANYMFGIPTETYGEMIQTLLMIKKMKPDYYSPALFTPYPETKLYEYCQDHDLLRFKHFSEYRRSLSGDKIKGFNYTLIRVIVFLSLPLKHQLETIRLMLK